MAEVGIHLKDIIRFVLNRPFESGDIGRPQTEFTGALHDMHTSFVFTGHEALYDIGCTIGRHIVNHKHIKLQRQFHHRRDNRFDILFFVISRNND